MTTLVPPDGQDLAELRGYRSLMLVPLLSEQKPSA